MDKTSIHTIRIGNVNIDASQQMRSMEDFRARYSKFEAYTGNIDIDDSLRTMMKSSVIVLTCSDDEQYTLLAYIAAAKNGLMLAQLRAQFAKTRDHVRECVISAQLLHQLYDETHDRSDTEKYDIRDRQAQRTIYDSQFRELIEHAMKLGASDVHFRYRNDGGEKYGNILFRIDGELEKIDEMQPENLLELVAASYAKADNNSLAEGEGQFNMRRPMSCFIRLPDLKNVEMRFQSDQERYGFDAAIRILNFEGKNSYRDLEMLGYLPEQVQIMKEHGHGPRGAIVLAGETGSGKTTSLNALAASHPDVRSGISYASSVEDPPEGRPPGLSQFAVARSADQGGVGAENPFVPSLRVRLRSDVDILILGETRDVATAEVFEQLAMTGHKVYTSVHAGSCQGVYERFISPLMGLSYETVGSEDVLGLVGYQKLLAKLCPHCRVPAQKAWSSGLQKDKLEKMQKLGAEVGNLYIRNIEGCPHCHRGHKGMQVVAELFTPTSDQRMLIVRGRIGEAFRMWRGSRKSELIEPGVIGKTAFEIGVYFASQGIIGLDSLDEKIQRILSYEELARHD